MNKIKIVLLSTPGLTPAHPCMFSTNDAMLKKVRKGVEELKKGEE